MIQTDLIVPIAELLERQAQRFPDKVAYSDARRSITYGELDKATHNLATHFRAFGLKDNGAVAIWLPNCVEWVIVCLAAVRARGMAVPISYDATGSEVGYRLEDAGCAIVVTREERAPVLSEMADSMYVPQTRIFLGTDQAGGGHDFDALCASPAPGVTLEPDDIDVCSYIVYTSGTTGRPKGVMLSSRALLWATAACWAPILGYGEHDRVLSPLPMFHVFSLTIAVLSPLATGASAHVMDRFSVHTAIDLLKSGGFTFVPAVPTMFHYILLEGGKLGKELFSGVRLCTSAGAIMPASLSKEFEETFGVEMIDGYGITEMSTMVTMNWPGKYRFPGSCGLPVPGLALRIVNPATGIDVPFGDEGELIARGPTLMLGYNRNPEATAQAIRDGWYHTGDLARSDKHGFITITGRLKEIIIRGGQNIAPAEVEETIVEIDEVMDCAVVGIPHDTLGEVAYAFIVLHEGKSLTAETVKAHCASSLSVYKIPEEVRIIEQIPRTGSGKIMRFKLRELIDSQTPQ
ncbi:MAG: AMP-binding protein [Rhodobiaceae bacterium]|nr:AMP-binding protein [Rhodobiaceae bacterium]MCC0061354.1 AMP-binding protein [Rhodobiaceae bacterium]